MDANTYPVTFINSWIVDSSKIETAGDQCVTFASGKNGRLGPLPGAALTIYDVTDSLAGCSPEKTVARFTPHLAGADTPDVDTNGYASRLGYWTRSGKLVHVYAQVILSFKGAGSGVAMLSL